MFSRLILLFMGAMLSGCGFYRWQLGSYYSVRASSKALTEQAIISLIQDGSIQVRSDVWRPIIERQAALAGGELVGHWVDNSYVVKHRNRKGFVIFHPANRTFYSFDFCNCGAPVEEPEGLVGPNCDLRIHSINALQQDSVLHAINWPEAGPALAEFRKNILPVIRCRVAALDQQRP
ncbi:hypothetical protein EJV47_10190 [Hymenobacter gummosus]|uniref:Lipoprotein n=1 Tax=Hymenobacter gummosus TaxID=1776032 RepID=A0A3S0H9I0_9BACT|nr:hypothetical protein [Hymenobacter gummosus]RTQ50003.1 hypothetical protein EJV47_10190 [Hymenobacter gummosus]